MITYSFTLELPCLRVTWVTDSETKVCMLEFYQGGCSEAAYKEVREAGLGRRRAGI